MKKYLILFILPLLPFVSKAQTIYSMSWDTSLGVGDTQDYIGAFSGRGATLVDVRAFVSPYISVGGYLGWHTLYEEVNGTFTNDNQQTLTGNTRRYLNSFPILAHAHYYFGEDDGSPTPYAGLGLGAYSIEQRTDAGLFSVSDSQWHFGFAPEVGVLIPTAGDAALILKAKYNHAFENGGNVGPYQYFNFGLGFAWY